MDFLDSSLADFEKRADAVLFSVLWMTRTVFDAGVLIFQGHLVAHIMPDLKKRGAMQRICCGEVLWERSEVCPRNPTMTFEISWQFVENYALRRPGHIQSLCRKDGSMLVFSEVWIPEVSGKLIFSFIDFCEFRSKCCSDLSFVWITRIKRDILLFSG